MSNILQFRLPDEQKRRLEISNSGKAACVALRDEFQSESRVLGLSGDALTAMTNTSLLTEENWGYVAVRHEASENRAFSVCLETNFRQRLVEEYVSSRHTEFLRYSVEASSIKPDNSYPMLHDLDHRLAGYYSRFHELKNRGQYFEISYLLLALFTNTPEIEILSYSQKDGYQISFLETCQENGQCVYITHSLKFDALPILLDQLAIDWYVGLDDKTLAELSDGCDFTVPESVSNASDDNVDQE